MAKKRLFQKRKESLFGMNKKQLLERILQEQLNIHDHLGRLEVLYMMVNGVKQDDKGAWIVRDKEHRDEKKN